MDKKKKRGRPKKTGETEVKLSKEHLSGGVDAIDKALDRLSEEEDGSPVAEYLRKQIGKIAGGLFSYPRLRREEDDTPDDTET